MRPELSQRPIGADAQPSVNAVELFSGTLAQDIRELDQILRRTAEVQGHGDVLEALDAWAAECRVAAEQGGGLPEQVGRIVRERLLSEDGAAWVHSLLSLIATKFHLMNRAEELEIARRNRARHEGRPESIAEALRVLRVEHGLSFQEASSVVMKTLFIPVWTPHPTQSKTDEVLRHLERVGGLLEDLRREGLTDGERRVYERELRSTVEQLYSSEEHPQERRTVEEEHEQALFYLSNVVFDVIPRIYRDIEIAFEREYGQIPEIPTIVQYGSWFIGDRDGNEAVTAPLTEDALRRNALTALRLHRERAVKLSEYLTAVDPRGKGLFSEELKHILDGLDSAHQTVVSGGWATSFSAHEYRQALGRLEDALTNSGYTVPPLLEDLRVQAKVFGFHLVSTDIRQHSAMYEQAVDTLLLMPEGLRYRDLSEEDRVALLRDEILSDRQRIGRRTKLSPEEAALIEQVVAPLEVIATAQGLEPALIGSCIVSMTHDLSDLLEVYLLLKEVGLLEMKEGELCCSVPVVPLIETGEDLDAAKDRISLFLGDPVVGRVARESGRFEVMLGPSDSNKDVGYVASTWKLYRAAEGAASACREAGIERFRLFWGRGGSHARGGGRLHRSILATSPLAFNGITKVTYQGEAISARQGDPRLAYRDLEQALSASFLAHVQPQLSEEIRDQVYRQVGAIAERAADAYRSFVSRPDFWEFYLKTTPFELMRFLNNNARPVVRFGRALTFENARAIPWNQCWTQVRANVPGWYGAGSGVQAAIREAVVTEEECRELFAHFPPFRIMIETVQRELARARPTVFADYSNLWTVGSAVRDGVLEEYHQTRGTVASITGIHALWVNSPAMQGYIDEARNPLTDVANIVQMTLLSLYHEFEKGDLEDPGRLKERIARDLVPLSINVIAAAMQSTG